MTGVSSQMRDIISGGSFVRSLSRLSEKYNIIMDILGLGSKVDADFILDPQGQRKQIDVKVDDTKRSLQYIYYDGEDVSGT
ncbi:unnamed protein product, partial [Rotaria sp. Silwood2]